MNIGIVGFGKLGGPIAVALAHRGHRILASDVYPERVLAKHWPHCEQGYDGLDFDELLRRADVELGSPSTLARQCEIIFVVVQTPHRAEFEGAGPLPAERADFDYSYLKAAVTELAREVERHGQRRTIAVVSTVLPGTTRERLASLCGHLVDLVYNPAFPAMGTAVRDFLEPEFVLVGTRVEGADGGLCAFYRTVTNAPQVVCSWQSAEATKVLYNTFITSKIVFANAAMEVCHKAGANVDDVSDALALATRRIVSPAYMRGGMGDGGACHPRDLIAMSWLARSLGLSYDFFGALAQAREEQAAWLCGLVSNFCRKRCLEPFILGTAFKAETAIETGSAALLCRAILEEDWDFVPSYDPFVDGPATEDAEHRTAPHVFLVGSNHPEFAGYVFPKGSVVVDPWRYISDQEGVTVVRVGES